MDLGTTVAALTPNAASTATAFARAATGPTAVRTSPTSIAPSTTYATSVTASSSLAPTVIRTVLCRMHGQRLP